VIRQSSIEGVFYLLCEKYYLINIFITLRVAGVLTVGLRPFRPLSITLLQSEYF